jgi:hypothetical protein
VSSPTDNRYETNFGFENLQNSLYYCCFDIENFTKPTQTETAPRECQATLRKLRETTSGCATFGGVARDPFEWFSVLARAVAEFPPNREPMLHDVSRHQHQRTQPMLSYETLQIFPHGKRARLHHSAAFVLL